jgi:tetratricopeptide (TPR) repeat protein
VVENVHWSDPTSAAWLASLVERLPEAAVLLVGTYRPGYPPVWGTHTAVTQIAVPPLRPRDSRTVVQAVLGAAALPAPRLRAIVEHAGGNPFFLEELAWHALEQGGRDTPGAVPETVQAVLAARLDRLPPEAKHLLQTAAVIGLEVPVPLLQTLVESAEASLYGSLEYLQATEFLYETRLFPEQVYTFKHALTHEVAYSSLLLERRQVLHARIVEAIEALSPERLAEEVDRLAYHALRGAVWDKALAYCRQAGDKAVAGSAYREAVGYFEQGLAALAHLPTNRTTCAQGVDLRLLLRHALIPFGAWEQALTHLRAAEHIAAALGDHRRLGRVYRSMADTLQKTHPAPALLYSQRAYTIATALGDVETQIWGHLTMAQAYHDLGNYCQGIACLQQALTTLQGMPPVQSLRYMTAHPVIQARTWLVCCLMQLGAFAEGVASGHDAGQMAEAGGCPYDRLSIYVRLGRLYVCQGRLPQAIPLLERAVALSQEARIPVFERLAAGPLALAYALAGRATDALTVLGQTQRSGKTHLYVALACGEAYLRVGCREEAHQLIHEVLTDARHLKEQGWEAWALWLLGEIAMRRGPLDVAQAKAHYQQALALAEALGMRPLQAHCHSSLGTLYATTGQQEQARAALSAAIEMYCAMDMAFWLPQAEAALAQIGESARAAGGVS